MTNVAAGNPASDAPQLFIPAGWKGLGQPPLYTAEQIAALTTAAAVPADMERAARVCESRSRSLSRDGDHAASNEAKKCAGAIRAAAPKAEPVPVGEYPPLPAPFIGVQDQPWGGHAEVIRSAIGEDGVVSCYTEDQMRTYVDADRAMRAQAAPAAVAGPSDEEIESVWGRYDEGLETRVALARRILALAAPAPPAQAADSVLEDAARYRWLRAGVRERQGVPVSGHRTMSSNHLRALMEFNFWCTPDELDAAIDAARAQAKEGA